MRNVKHSGGRQFLDLHAFVIYCIALIISLKSTSAVHSSAVPNMHPRASRAALCCPGRSWMSQQGDNVPLQLIQSARTGSWLSNFVLTLNSTTIPMCVPLFGTREHFKAGSSILWPLLWATTDERNLSVSQKWLKLWDAICYCQRKSFPLS